MVVTGPAAELPRALLERLTAVLESHGIREFAFTGGVAVGVWATPRQTHDLDLCGVLPPAELDRLLALRDGIRTGAGAMPDLVRFRVQDWDVDLFVCKGPYDRRCLDRAVAAELGGFAIRVVTAEDLLIHKMMKLRTDRRRMLQDLADLRAVIEAQSARLDWNYLREWLPVAEMTFLTAVATESDESLARRLLGPDPP
jgi:hypothetical protein